MLCCFGFHRPRSRQVAELQDEADKERRMRGKLSNEKRKLELDLQGQQDTLDEERKYGAGSWGGVRVRVGVLGWGGGAGGLLGCGPQ